jgi:uridine kinase
MVYIIGIAGGTSSGKTTTCHLIQQQLDSDIEIISMDSFYLGIKDDQNSDEINFDHPDCFDWDLIYSTLTHLKQRKSVDIPVYNFDIHQRDGSVRIQPKNCIILEGILALYDPAIRKLFDIKIYVDTPSDIRLIRRIRRDTQARGRSLESVLKQCENTVIPSYSQFIEPTKRYADLIIPRGKSNVTAISVMVNQIWDKIKNK